MTNTITLLTFQANDFSFPFPVFAWRCGKALFESARKIKLIAITKRFADLSYRPIAV
jgi:hypothetical protein